MKLTYTIQVCNESRELFSLLNFLKKTVDDEDEINVVVDSNNKTDRVDMVLAHFKDTVNIYERPFDKFHTNAQFHIEKATGEYIFGMDADEMPQEMLVRNIKQIINDTQAELITIPRINIHPGITAQDAKDHGFHVNESGFINWPDYQTRIFKRCDYIHWTDTLHTKLVGSDKSAVLKPNMCTALWHIKSMEKQNSRWKKEGPTGEYNISRPSTTDLYDLLM
jgi:hypothetical protein